jgi:microcystin-dependent protein
MSQPYVGQILIFAGNFAPSGWMLCQGQQLPISEYETLFNLIGTTYGGDGQSTFNLPDLRGRVALHQGQGGGLSNYTIGQLDGFETVTLTTQQLPSHNHASQVASVGDSNTPGPTTVLANEGGADASSASIYAPFDTTPANMTTLLPTSVTTIGGSQPHENRQPYLVINYIISLFGVYPSPT